MSRIVRAVVDEGLEEFHERQAEADSLSLSSYMRRLLAAHRRQCEGKGYGNRIPETSEPEDARATR